jgi:poly(3-hydroxybutyrate) depolymerase
LLLLPPQLFDPNTHGRDNFAGLLSLARREHLAVAVLLGRNLHFNVFRNLRASPGEPDDVAYAKSALQRVASLTCIDAQRVYCVGLSNGGRLCQRLVSELPGRTFAAMALFSAVRYPVPNNGTHPIPMIAFHGTDDGINPYFGSDVPEYWGPLSVPHAVQRWAGFNGCSRLANRTCDDGVVYSLWTDCWEGADTELVTIRGAGHSWPFLTNTNATYRPVKHDEFQVPELDITKEMWRFLSRFPQSGVGKGSGSKQDGQASSASDARLNQALLVIARNGRNGIPAVKGCRAHKDLRLRPNASVGGILADANQSESWMTKWSFAAGAAVLTISTVGTLLTKELLSGREARQKHIHEEEILI